MMVQYEPPATTWLAGKRIKKIKVYRGSAFFADSISSTSGSVSIQLSIRIAHGMVGDGVLGQAVLNTFVRRPCCQLCL